MSGRNLILLAVLLTGAACSSPGPSDPPTAAAPTTPTSGPAADRVEQARGDLADRLGVPQEDISVLEGAAVVWPNAGLGCPHHEQEYDPAPVPGYRIVLGHRSLEYRYHGADGQAPFLCQFLD